MNFFKNKPLLITIVIVILLIFLIMSTASSNKLSEPTTAMGSAFVPLQRFFYQVSSNIAEFFSSEESDHAQQNEQLRLELNEYKTKLMDYNELVAENERLKTALGYKEDHPNQELKIAKITGKEPGNWFDVFIIDLGTKDGIVENMPVVTPDGLVGRIEEVGLNWSKVMAVIDGRSRVSAIMERTRDVGVAAGTITGSELTAYLTMEYLPLDSDIVEGDVVVTSGLDNLFPKGFVIGTVVNTNTEGESSSVSIKPSVDFRRLSEVMVVVEAEDTTSVVSQDIADSQAAITPRSEENDEILNPNAADAQGAVGDANEGQGE